MIDQSLLLMANGDRQTLLDRPPIVNGSSMSSRLTIDSVVLGPGFAVLRWNLKPRLRSLRGESANKRYLSLVYLQSSIFSGL